MKKIIETIVWVSLAWCAINFLRCNFGPRPPINYTPDALSRPRS